MRIGVGFRIGPLWISAGRSTRRRPKHPTALETMRRQAAYKNQTLGERGECDQCRRHTRVRHHPLDGMLCADCHQAADARAAGPQDAVPPAYRR